MRHWRTLIEKDYLGAWDLMQDGKPRDFVLVIARVAAELLKTRETPKGKRKAVLTFRTGNGREVQKRFVANATNCSTIAGMYGDDVDKWVGKPVALYVGEARDPKTGRNIPAIRVRPKPPTGPVSDDEPNQPVDEKIRDQQDEAFDGNQ